jgi:superoxide dismutase, Fe-Mn family
MLNLKKEIKKVIDNSLDVLKEAYVTEPKKFLLKTELLSEKVKKTSQEIFELHIKALNRISAELDGADKSEASNYNSNFRSLKKDEIYNINMAFLKALHFDNISDLNSQITMDTLSFIRISRDFGNFENWQKDFIACCMASRSGFAITAYSLSLKRYINFVIDGSTTEIPIGIIPVIVLDVSEFAYYRDYLNDKLAYVHGMMKEFNWEIIEQRIEKCEKIAKIGI